MTIEKAKFSDIGKILELHNKNFNYFSFYFWFFMGFLPFGEILVAKENSKLAGYVMSFRNRITETCVAKEAQGRGVGKELIGKSSVNKYSEAVVYTANKNDAVEFYKSLGFRIARKGKIVKLSKNNY